MTTTEELQLKRKEIRQQLSVIDEQLEELVSIEHYPYFQSLIGKCFKSRNSFSGPKDGWWAYEKIIDIKPDDVYWSEPAGRLCHCRVLRFETYSNGQISIETKRDTYTHSVGDEITEKEFNKEWNKLVGRIESLQS